MKYPGQENVTLEFKENFPQNNQIVNTVIGFCNQFGGRLVLGVNDDGGVVGLVEEDIDKTIDVLQESIYKSCTPPIIPLIHAQSIDDKIVVIIEVSSGMNKPYFRTSAGLNEGCYIRLGAHTVKASPEIIQELQWQAQGHSIDVFPLYRASINDLDMNAFEHFLNNRKIIFKTSDVTSLLGHYDCFIEQHARQYPTTAGMLLFGKDPQRFLTEAFVICTHFKGSSGREVLATRDCTGTLFEQLSDCMAFLEDRLYKSFAITGIKRDEQLEIPVNALREMVLNALIHRNYQIPAPNKIAIYDDRVEIHSPGNFPGPLRVDELECGITYVRNRIINKIFREIGLSEKLGSGFRTLFQSYRERHLTPPQVIEGGGFVKCILPRTPMLITTEAKKEEHQEAIMKLFFLANEITSHDVANSLSVSRQTALRWLTALLDKGLIEKRGKRAGTRYRKGEKKM